jgi:hypothetical protein
MILAEMVALVNPIKIGFDTSYQEPGHNYDLIIDVLINEIKELHL